MGIDLAEVDAKIRRDDLKGAVQDLLLHVKLLAARIDDLRADERKEGTRQALLKGLGRRR